MWTPAFATLFISVFAAMLGLGIVAPLMPLFAEDLGAAPWQLGLLFASFGIARFIFSPRIGAIADRGRRKRIAATGMALYSAMSLGYIGAAQLGNLAIPALILVRFGQGVASAAVIPIASGYIAELAPVGREGKWLGTFHVSMFLGFGLGPFLGGVVAEAAGFDAAFIAMGALAAVAFILVLMFLPESKPAAARPRGTRWSLLELPMVRALFTYRAMHFLARGGFFAFLAIFAHENGVSTMGTGILLTVNMLTTSLLQPFTGRLADRLPRPLLLVGGATVMGGSLFSIPFTDGQGGMLGPAGESLPFGPMFWLLLVPVSLMGIGGAIAQPANQAMIATVGREHGMGFAMGVLDSAMSLGIIGGPLIAGLVMQGVGVHWVFHLTGAFGVGSAAAFYALARNGTSGAGASGAAGETVGQALK
jgi:MFS family permease